MNKLFFSFILITVTLSAVFTSCNKDDDEYSSPTPFSGGLSGVIEGEYASWDFVGISFGGGDIVETTPIIDGKFTFSSLPTPKPEDLAPFIESEEVPINIQISDKDAKICSISLLAIKGEVGASYEGRGIVQGDYVYPNSVNMFMYYYADKDLKVKGSWSGTNIGVKFSSEININLKRGWNTLLLIIDSTEENGQTTTLKNGIPPTGNPWTGIII